MAEHLIQPDAHAAPIPLPERMRHIHLDILLHDLIKCRVRHGIDIHKRCIKIHHWGEAKVSFGEIDGAHFAGEVIDFAEKEPVNRSQRLKSSWFQRIQKTAFE